VLLGEHAQGQQIDLLVASPLHRTLHTATLAFGGLEHIPRVVSRRARTTTPRLRKMLAVAGSGSTNYGATRIKKGESLKQPAGPFYISRHFLVE
jgi:hypothetical protein